MNTTCSKYKNVVAILLIVAMVFVMAGCKDEAESSSVQTKKTVPETTRQVTDGIEDEDEMRRWVESLNDTFKDDHFEYDHYFHNIIDAEGHPTPGEGIVVVAKSEKYPDQEIHITNTLTPNGEHHTDYNSIRYKEDIEKYCKGIFEERLNCDSCEVICQSEPSTPIEDMSFEKYLQEYAYFDFTVIMYSKDSAFTGEKQTVDELVRIVKEQNKSCDINLFYCNEGVDGPYHHNYVCFYSLVMSNPNEILYIRLERNSGEEFETLVENMTW
ncbi:MAG: hypothetical protein IK020_10145 [Clostridiales bacterium]|nr:hypothetical protein [Clostridiales bacterium]